jgi:hypothetical protein
MALRTIKLPCVLLFGAFCLTLIADTAAQGTASSEPANPASQATPLPAPPQQAVPGSNYDKALFQKPIPADQLAFLNQFASAPANDLIRDKQFRKLLSSIIPNCMFHYGTDMPLADAVDLVIKGSKLPVQIRDSRYLMVSGLMGPHHAGKGFLWIDLQDGIGLGGFYFHPGNGEPTPSVNIFSRQVLKQVYLSLSELPPAFVDDFIQWSTESKVAAITPLYFITGSNKKVLLEHDEDYCLRADGTTAPPGSACEQLNADAADIDMTDAYYLEQVNYATNATAWMIVGPEQTSFIHVRDDTCRRGPDPLGCHIRMTREHTHGVAGGHSGGHGGHR